MVIFCCLCVCVCSPFVSISIEFGFWSVCVKQKNDVNFISLRPKSQFYLTSLNKIKATQELPIMSNWEMIKIKFWCVFVRDSTLLMNMKIYIHRACIGIKGWWWWWWAMCYGINISINGRAAAHAAPDKKLLDLVPKDINARTRANERASEIQIYWIKHICT